MCATKLNPTEWKARSGIAQSAGGPGEKAGLVQF